MSNYTEQERRGICPMCNEHGKVPSVVGPVQVCPLCEGSGAWPPPEPEEEDAP